MAAINCPECNGLVGHGVRKCPHCGFDICQDAIRAYKDELKKDRDIRIAKYNSELKPKLDEEIATIEKEYNEMKCEYSQRPSYLRELFFGFDCKILYIDIIIFLISTIVAINIYSTLAALLAGITVIVFILLLITTHDMHQVNLHHYERFHSGKAEKEKQDRINDIIEKYQYEAKLKSNHEEDTLIEKFKREHFDKADTPTVSYSPSPNTHKSSKSKDVPKCPICGSTDLTQISTVKKAAKVATFGIYGAGDIGKTWRCNNCKSKF